MRKSILTALLICLISMGQVRADPTPYPKPSQSLQQAISLATTHFKKPNGKGEPTEFKDWRVLRVEYTNYNTLRKKTLDEWSWVVTFRSPSDYSQSWWLQVKRNGEVRFLGITE